MNQPPKPNNSGSSGTQVSEKNVTIVESQSPLAELPIADRINGLATTNSKSLGGEVSANILAGYITQLSYELQASKSQLKDNQKELKESQENLHFWKEKSAVLQERVNSSQIIRNLGNITITLGTALLGISIELYRNSFKTVSYIGGVIGVGLILLGWLAGRGGDKS